MEKIRAAIIGLGRIGSLLEADALREKPCTHAGAIAANAGCVLAAGCDHDEERRRLFAEKWHTPVYADAAVMIRRHAPQILCVATHPDSHLFYCKLASDCSVPVLICEKPLAQNLASAKRIAAIHTSRKARIITNHERRYQADYIRAADILASKKLGALLSVRAVLYMGKNNRLLDTLWHDGTHLADAIMFLTGAELRHRQRCGAKLTSRSGTAWLAGELQTAEKSSAAIPVIIEIGAGRDHLAFEIEFSCEQGRLRTGNGVFEVWESSPCPYAERFRSLKQTVETFSGPSGYFANMISDAVSCVCDPGRQPVSSAIDGLKVIKYLHSVMPWK